VIDPISGRDAENRLRVKETRSVLNVAMRIPEDPHRWERVPHRRRGVAAMVGQDAVAGVGVAFG
jgi:hypothetical protein